MELGLWQGTPLVAYRLLGELVGLLLEHYIGKLLAPIIAFVFRGDFSLKVNFQVHTSRLGSWSSDHISLPRPGG